MKTLNELAIDCAEFLATIAMTLPETCPKEQEEPCDDEECFRCRAYKVSMPYLEERNRADECGMVDSEVYSWLEAIEVVWTEACDHEDHDAADFLAKWYCETRNGLSKYRK